MTPRRTAMIASSIQRELAEIIIRDLNDPRLVGMPSITRVKLATDLSTCEVFVTIMGSPGQQSAALNALKSSAGLMRGRVTKSLGLRVAPFISFQLDEQLRKELSLLETLDQVRREREARELAQAGQSPDGEVSAEASTDVTGSDPVADSPPTDGETPAGTDRPDDPEHR